MHRAFGALAIAAAAVVAPQAVHAQAGTWYSNQGVTIFGANTMSVWGTSPSSLWLAGGYQHFEYWNGSSWSMPTQPGTLNRYTVWGFGGGQVYTAGQNGYQTGAVHSCTTTTCTTIYTAETELTGLWGRSPNDLFVSGDGIIRHYNGTSWTNLATGLSTAFNTNRLVSISGGATRTFFSGYNGLMFSYDGSVLTQMVTGTTSTLSSVSAVNDNLAYAVGAGGTILRWDGSVWTPMASGTTNDLTGVFALNANSVYAAGVNGTVLYFNGTSWVPVDVGIGGTLGTPFALSESQVYIPRANGQYGEVITSDPALGGLLLVQSTVPEPGTLVLLAGGLVAFGVVRRRRAT